MKTHKITRFGAIAVLFCAQIFSAMAVTFTQDTFISFGDFSHEGQDIVVTNCTLTVDGPHIFRSLEVQNGGVVTHSPNTNGPQQFTFLVSNEPHMMSATNPATLYNGDVDTDTIAVFNASRTALYTEDVDYVVTHSNQFVQLTLTTNSSIAEGATVLVNYDWAEDLQGFILYINNDASIRTGGAIDVSGKGYQGGNGVSTGLISGGGGIQVTNFPFVFTAGGGGGHGGAGGISSTSAHGGASYDSTTNPATLGSGGGGLSGTNTAGGAGGGSATILIGGNFQVDGKLVADGFRGTNAHSGGGAGGSLFLSAETFSGAGIISANGGGGDTPNGGGGGGGRIAMYFATNNFTGTLSAFGGVGFMAGGAGTVYQQADSDSAGQLFIVNGGKRGTNTTFSAPVSDLTISGGAVAQATTQMLVVTNLLVGSNSWLMSPDLAPLTVTVNGDATVEASGVINADFRSSSGLGSGSAACGAGSGGSYGGVGGASVCGTPGGAVYGSISQPTSLGSPGPATRGGGAINMTVAGNLSLAGKISANGASATTTTSGSGSGGSVLLSVGTLSGAGIISANGGSSSNLVSGGGGGGRIAVYFDTNAFTGSLTARGGTGTNSGGPGSIYLKSRNDSIPQIVFDNGGVAGFTAIVVGVSPSDLTISGGTVLSNYLGGVIVLRNLFIGSNSWYTTPPFGGGGFGPGGSFAITATNVTIQPGGGIRSDGVSTAPFPIGGGLGNGLGIGGGGGGGAGFGGAGSTNTVLGGFSTSSFSNPLSPGGMGGLGNGPGGLGGGVISLTVPGTLRLDGRISANGLTPSGFNGGGGGGGSIYLSAHTITGTGTISANGGAAAPGLGGGGGGGAIALFTDTNLFSGSMSAFGGAGLNPGGAGTIYFARYTTFILPEVRQLLIDNGGTRGARTPLATLSEVSDLTITGGATVSNGITTLTALKNLLVGSNSVFQFFSAVQPTFSVSSNVTVLAGGSINVDGLNGGTSGTGFGLTLNGTGGGGGGAGTGGASALGAAGGVAIFDSVTAPISLGGRGGGGALQSSTGGNGGGALKMTIGNTLRVDGRISAEGLTSSTVNAGGGGGGSISLSTKVFSGAGTISANGGAGNLAGGGGGGGHIAITCTSNLFTGSLTARGGIGANAGGAGSIYTSSGSPTGATTAQVILDNGGLVGGYTPLSSLPQLFNFTVTGGAIFSNSSYSSFTLQNLLIGSNSTWLTPSIGSFSFTVLTNATIQSGGLFSLDGTTLVGPAPGQTVFNHGGGGGHGGYGGASSNAAGGTITSDSITSPTGTGSQGGNSGGYGGGAMQLTVRGTLQVDGRISANGVSGTNALSANSGGGSGGSLFLQIGKLTGAGTISANGAAANNLGGSGGGGRVAVWYNTNLFTGAIMARGGAGANPGGPGTVFLNPSVTDIRGGRLIFDNGGANGPSSVLLNPPNSMDVIVTNGATLSVGVSGTANWNNLIISSNSSLNLASNSSAVRLNLASNVDVQAGGSLNLDGQGGRAVNATQSPGGIGNGGGGGHGGMGSAGVNANSGGQMSFDSINNPTMAGGGGGSALPTTGSSGGGVIQLTIAGALKVNGVISANGIAATTGGAGGGAGGSVWLSAGIISGNGRISADGGNGDLFTSGGGGGGRIAISFKTNQFTGTISAHGGLGATLAGGAGTIYLESNSNKLAQLIVENGGATSTNTPLLTGPLLTGLSIRNGGVADSVAPLNLQSLLIDTGGRLVGHTAMPTIILNVAGDALIDTDGAIASDVTGRAANTGTGAGEVGLFGFGSGGGYGGAGGASFDGAPGGMTYGSSNKPVDLGSGGGVFPPLAGYSAGGGTIRLTVNGTLTVNGNISANGADGILDGAGGGAGGSIWIATSKFAGTGLLTVNGGAGESFEGGGGGGGRIAIYSTSNSFSGNLLALGGDGAFPGQNGTIYTSTSILISGNVTDANGAAIAGLTLQPSGLASLNSDVNGAYSLAVPVFWTGSVTPNGSGTIVPSIRNYSALTADSLSQNFVVTTPAAFNLTGSQFDGTNVTFSWYGMKGVLYQPEYSTNLVDWSGYGQLYLGANAPITVTVPPTDSPLMYFRLNVTY